MQATGRRGGADCFVSLRFFRLSKNMMAVVGGYGWSQVTGSIVEIYAMVSYDGDMLSSYTDNVSQIHHEEQTPF